MSCEKCKSDRLASIVAKCVEAWGTINGIEFEYLKGDRLISESLPYGLGLGDEDEYLYLNYCLDCGQMEGEFPLPKTEVEIEYEEDRRGGRR